MPLKTAEGFLLRAHSVGEADQILVFLTENDGKLRGLAHSSRRSRKRFGGALQLLSRVRFSYFESERRDLARIDQCDLVHPFFWLREDLRTAGYLSYVAELAEEFSREKQEEQPFYRLLGATLAAVEAGLDPAWAARYFELWTLRLHGLLPDLAACTRCEGALGESPLYAPAQHALMCGRCASKESGPRVPSAALAHLRALLRRPPTGAAGPSDLLDSCEGLLQEMLTGFTERPFRSLRVLREMGVR